MSRTISRSVTAFVSLVVGLVVITTGVSGQIFLGGSPPQGPWAAQPSTKNGEWPSYNADIRGTRYSPLNQINASNFNKLEVAWRFRTESLGHVPNTSWKGRRSWSKACCIQPAAYGARSSRSTVKRGSSSGSTAFGKGNEPFSRRGNSQVAASRTGPTAEGTTEWST